MPTTAPNSHPTYETGITYNAQASGSFGAKRYETGQNQEVDSGIPLNPFHTNGGSVSETSHNSTYQSFQSDLNGSGTNVRDHILPGPSGSNLSQADESFAAVNLLSPLSQQILNDLFSQTEQPVGMAEEWGFTHTITEQMQMLSDTTGLTQASHNYDTQNAQISDAAISAMAEGIGRLGTTVSPTENSQDLQDDYVSPSIPQVFSSDTQSFATSNSPLGVGVLPDPAESRLVKGWHDSTDLPSGMRDKLLGLFFKKAGNYFLGTDMPRLRTRLTLEPRKRPHPCWMYSMVSTPISTCQTPIG